MIAVAARKPGSQAEAIRVATLRSLRARDLYTEEAVSELTGPLLSAQKDVHAAILEYKTLGSLPDNKLAALKGVEKLDGELREIMGTLKREQTLAFRRATKESHGLGIRGGVGELVAAKLPFYAELTPEGIDKLSTRVFTLIDTDALDFMTNYNLILAGDVNRELADGIKRVINTGIMTGKSVDDMVRDLGLVVKDPDSFRHAGARTFSKAQYRMEMIVRTETLRAHNQGRMKFHQEAGVRKLEWLGADDERMCEQCGALAGRVFDIDKFPQQPAHAFCRCSSVIAWPMVICDNAPRARAAEDSGACILSPQQIEQLAQDKAEEDAALKAAFEGGKIEDLNALTIKQLQALAKQNGVSTARTKADFIKLLDQFEPGIDHSGLSGAALKSKVKQHKIGALRPKDELAGLLAQKQAALKQAQAVVEELQKVPPGGLHNLTVKELQEMAKSKKVSLNMTKSDVIAVLDQLEPGIDHSGLSGAALAQAKKKHKIGALKNKQQLIDSLEKAAGEELADAAKKQALTAAEQQAVQKAHAAVDHAVAQVAIPQAPGDYKGFLAAVKTAEDAIGGHAAKLPKDFIEIKAQELALKKKLFRDQVSAMNHNALKDLAKETQLKHWQWANKGELATIFTETDPVKLQQALAGIEAKHSKWALKHGSKKAAVKPPKAAAPPPAAAPPVSAPPQFVKKTSLFDDVDQAWAAKGKPQNFKFLEKADIDGAHTKYFYLDEHGDKWLFKPVRERFRAHGDEVAYKIGRLIDPDAIDVRVIELDGRVGSIQRWRTDLAKKFDFSDVNILDLTPGEVAQIQREHVIDWLIANHDGHAKQFLRARDGRVYGIDKGQLFKFLGDDRLDIAYHPNRVHGESEPLYNILFRSVKQGKTTVDPAVTLKYIREAERIADDEYLALLRPYAEGRFGRNAAQKQAFYDMALHRKNNIRRDFEGFYADTLKRPGFKFEVPDAPVGARLSRAEIETIAEAQRARWQGKVLRFDVDDIEDQGALLFQELVGGKPRTVVKMKVRPEAEGKLLESLRRAGIRETAGLGKALPQDIFAGDILAAVKTVNQHASDFTYNTATLNKAAGHLKALQELARSADPDVKAMAQTYIRWIERVQDAVKDKKKISMRFNPHMKQHESIRPKPEAGFTVRRTEALQPRRELKGGEIIVRNDSVDNAAFFHSGITKGEQFEIAFPDGSRAVYRPWTKENLYAQRGEFEFYAAGPLKPETVERIMDRIESLGIKSTIPSPEQTEIMYLQKQAYIRKIDDRADYKRLLVELDKKDASAQERVSALRSFWEKELGVDDVTRLPGYEPMGAYQLEFRDPAGRAGYRNQYRFDISDADLNRQMKGYGLSHSLTNKESISDFVDIVLENNGAMVSTVEKMRVGVPVGGMSPAADMGTGGASYFFTRLRKLPTQRTGKPGLYFKKQLLRRMDAISYGGDKYGRVTGEFVRKNRYFTPEEWKQIARSSSNETIFKHSVTFLDNIDVIAVGSEAEMRRLLRVFEKHGIKKLPDGRDAADIIVVKQ